MQGEGKKINIIYDEIYIERFGVTAYSNINFLNYFNNLLKINILNIADFLHVAYDNNIKSNN